jgi:hypothetical protein
MRRNKKKKIEEENPNVEAHHDRHKENPKLGGNRAGRDEGNVAGSRGRQFETPDNEPSGSRTDKR